MSLPLECSAFVAYTEKADMRVLRDCSRTWPDHLAQPAPPASRDHWLLIKSPAPLIMRWRCFVCSFSLKDWVNGPALIKKKPLIRSLDSRMFNKSSQLPCGEAVPLLDFFQLINSYTGIKHGSFSSRCWKIAAMCPWITLNLHRLPDGCDWTV